MITIEYSVVINQPVEAVFAFLADHENDTKWRSGLVEWKKTSDGPIGVGSTSSETLQFMGRRMETSFEVTEYEENSKVGFKTTSGPVPMEGGYSLESAGSGTKLNFKIQGDAGGFFRLAEPLMAGIVRKQVESDLGNLKDLLESQAGSG